MTAADDYPRVKGRADNPMYHQGEQFQAALDEIDRLRGEVNDLRYEITRLRDGGSFRAVFGPEVVDRPDFPHQGNTFFATEDEFEDALDAAAATARFADYVAAKHPNMKVHWSGLIPGESDM